jgi:hypothetical protein
MSVDEFKKISKDVPLAKRPQPWWDLLSILGGIVAAVFWLLYSGIREGFDVFTPILMIGIPVVLVWFRADIDRILLPLQPFRQKFSKILLIGVGIAFPFLTSFVLYSMGIREYPLIQWNMLIGTFGAYAITRTPVVAMYGNGGPKSSPLPTGGFIALIIAAACAFLVLPVRADDCTRDVLNANDCLRTDGYAEVISGGFSTLVSILINGPTIIQTLINIGPGIQPPMPPVPPTGPQTQNPPQQQPPAQPTETPEEKAQREAEEAAQREEALRQMKAEKERLAAEAARQKALQKAKDKLLSNLKTMQDGMVKRKEFTVEDFNRINDQIIKVKNQLTSGGKVDVDLYSKIYRVYEGRVSGRTIPESMIPSDAQLFRETLQQTVETSSREIFTGVDADGKFSKKSLVLRTLIGGISGGSSELVYTPASATYTMKDYVDNGGNSILGAFGYAMKDVLIGEGIGKGAGMLFKYGGKAIGSLANQFLPKSAITSMTSSITSIKDGFAKIRNVLNTEIKNPFAGRPSGGVPGASQFGKSEAEITEQFLKGKQAGEVNPGLKNADIVPGSDPADLSGFSAKDQKAIRVIAEQNGVKLHFKASNPDSGVHLANGTANPKTCDIKVTTVSDADIPLGHSGENKGLVVFKEPAPPVRTPGMSDADFKAAQSRYDYRLNEYHAQKPGVDDLVQQGKVTVDPDTGLVRSTENNLPYASDNDSFGYTDAVTGKPVSPFTQNRINQQLQATGVTQHDHHLGWDYSGASGKDMGKLVPIDTKGLTGSKLGVDGAKPLNTFDPLNNKWGTSWYNGDTTRSFTPGGGQQ